MSTYPLTIKNLPPLKHPKNQAVVHRLLKKLSFSGVVLTHDPERFWSEHFGGLCIQVKCNKGPGNYRLEFHHGGVWVSNFVTGRAVFIPLRKSFPRSFKPHHFAEKFLQNEPR